MGARDEGSELAAGARVRKTVTIVFSDVVGSTALGERLDPEALQDVIGALRRRDAAGGRAARRPGREVHRRRGDGRVRGAGAARGRCASGRAGGARDARGARRPEPRARARVRRRARDPHRRPHRRGDHRRARDRPGPDRRRRRERRRPAAVLGAHRSGADRARDAAGSWPGRCACAVTATSSCAGKTGRMRTWLRRGARAAAASRCGRRRRPGWSAAAASSRRLRRRYDRCVSHATGASSRPCSGRPASASRGW